MKGNLVVLICIMIYGCTSNPFWQDKPTRLVTIRGKVFLENRETEVPVYVFIEKLGIGGYTDLDHQFNIEINGLETSDGNFSGEVKVFYFIHNYKIQYSRLAFSNGQLSSNQTDFDSDGNLISPVILTKLVKLDIYVNNGWKRQSQDRLQLNLNINVKDSDLQIISTLSNYDESKNPSGIFFYKSREECYYDQDNIDLYQLNNLPSNSSHNWIYFIEADDIDAPDGVYFIRPWFFIIQEEVPDNLYESLGLNYTYLIYPNPLNLPLDLDAKSISLL